MNKLKIISILIGFSVAQLNFAAEDPVYIGVSAGQSRVIQDVDGSYDIANTVTFTAGFIFSDNLSIQTSVETSYTQTVTKENVTLDGAANEYKAETLGLFVAARTKSDFYIKAKLGLVDHRITTNTIITYDAIKVSTGIGFGIKDDSGAITEIEYIVYDDDINLLNISYLF